MQLIIINGVSYTLPSNQKTVLNQIALNISKIFKKETASITKDVSDTMTINVVNLTKLLQILNSTIDKCESEERATCNRTLVVVKNRETNEIYGYYILNNRGNRVVYDSKLINITKEYYSLKDYPHIKKLAKHKGYTSMSENVTLREEILGRMFGITKQLDCNFINAFLKNIDNKEPTSVDKINNFIAKIIKEEITIISVDMLIAANLCITEEYITTLKLLLIDLIPNVSFNDDLSNKLGFPKILQIKY